MILSIFCHIFGKFSPFLSKLWDFRHISGDRRSWNNIYFAPNLSISGYFWGYLLDFGLFLLKIMDFEHIFVDTHPWNEVYFLGFEAYFVRIKPIFGDLSSFLSIFSRFMGNSCRYWCIMHATASWILSSISVFLVVFVWDLVFAVCFHYFSLSPSSPPIYLRWWMGRKNSPICISALWKWKMLWDGRIISPFGFNSCFSTSSLLDVGISQINLGSTHVFQRVVLLLP